MDWANRWFAIISGGVRDFDPDSWGITWDPNNPQWKYLFRPFFLAIDIETGRNFWEPVAAHTLPTWWSEIPQHGSNHIPYAIGNPLTLDIYDENRYLITRPGGQGDGYADLIYAGDLNGNLYTLMLYPNPGNFGDSKLICIDVHRTKPISTAHYDDNIYRGEYQPITVTPTAAFDIYKELRVYFGTGKYDNVESGGQDDKDDKEPMSFYCMIEPIEEGIDSCGNGTSEPITLLGKEIVIPDQYCTSDENTHHWVTEQGQPDGDGCFTCRYDFTTDGERVVDSALVAGGLVFVTTFIPNDDPYSSGGTSYLYVFDYMCRPLTYKYNPLENSGLNCVWRGLGVEGGWTPGAPPEGAKAAVYRATLGHGMPTRPVLDSSGKYVLIQTSDAKIHKIRVNLALKSLYLKGWKEKGE